MQIDEPGRETLQAPTALERALGALFIAMWSPRQAENPNPEAASGEAL